MDLSQLNSKLESGFDPKILLRSAHLPSIALFESSEFTDPQYLPFYYFLGSLIEPRRVIQVGRRLGLVGSCFMQGCKTVETWVAYEITPEPPSMSIKNLKMYAQKPEFVGCARSVSEEFSLHENCRVDLAIISDLCPKDKLRHYMSVLWEHLESEGLLVVDYIDHDAMRESFDEFCRVQNRESLKFKTRHGVGIITKR